MVAGIPAMCRASIELTCQLRDDSVVAGMIGTYWLHSRAPFSVPHFILIRGLLCNPPLLIHTHQCLTPDPHAQSIAIVYEPQPTPKLVPALAAQTVKAVACGQNHAIASDDAGASATQLCTSQDDFLYRSTTQLAMIVLRARLYAWLDLSVRLGCHKTRASVVIAPTCGLA